MSSYQNLPIEEVLYNHSRNIDDMLSQDPDAIESATNIVGIVDSYLNEKYPEDIPLGDIIILGEWGTDKEQTRGIGMVSDRLEHFVKHKTEQFPICRSDGSEESDQRQYDEDHRIRMLDKEARDGNRGSRK
jgi:hypothetical protein